MYRILIMASLCMPAAVEASWFLYDRAAANAQRGDWVGAKEQLARALVDAPDNANMLYDAGVSSYKTGDMSQAAAYFKRAAETADAALLKERAHFNLGNTYVQKKELEKALEQYEVVLGLNPTNERARHNRDVVKKMLEQQKQQENNSGDTQKDAHDSQKQNGADSQKNDSQNNAHEDPNGQTSQDNDNQGGENAQGQESDSQSAQSHKQKKQSDGAAQSHENTDEIDQSQAAHDKSHKKQQQSAGSADKEREQGNAKKETQAGSDHELNDVRKEQQHGGLSQEKPQNAVDTTAQKGSSKESALASWMEQLLKEQESRDARVNKYVMRAQVSQKMSGEDGQNCW